MKALENDSDWVEIYHVTGRLLVNPGALPEDDTTRESSSEIIRMVIEVGPGYKISDLKINAVLLEPARR